MENSGSFYNKELDMVINHPYGSDGYWKVFYHHFTKRRTDEMNWPGYYEHCWNSAHPDGPTLKEVEDNMNKIEKIDGTPT